MQTEETKNVKCKFSKKIGKLVIISFIILLIVAASLFYFFKIHASSNSTAEQRTSRVTRGDISVTVTGSGPMQYHTTYNLLADAAAHVTNVYYVEGDYVKKGALLWELDKTNEENTIEQLQNSINQLQVALNTSTTNANNLNVTAPFSGQVSNILVNVGQVIATNAPVLTLTDTSQLKLNVPFSSRYLNRIYVGEKANVFVQDYMQSVPGTITFISNKPYSTQNSGQLINVEITLSNPGGFNAGQLASAEIDIPGETCFSTSTGSFQYLNTTTVLAQSGGTVETINVKNYQTVGEDASLITCSDNTLVSTLNTNTLQMENLQYQLKCAQENLLNYQKFAPIDGLLLTLNIKQGDSAILSGSYATLVDPTDMEFLVPVDELDITKIQLGQKASITFDALPDTTLNPMHGAVTYINQDGTSSNGVTSYNITVTAAEPNRLKNGMNANATIMIQDKKNILIVPLEAIQTVGTENYVYVRSTIPNNNSKADSNWQSMTNNNDSNLQQDGNHSYRNNDSNNNLNQNNNSSSNKSSSGNSVKSNNKNSSGATQKNAYYANAERRKVALGVNDDTNIEIISGLNENDVIVLPSLSSSVKSSTTSSTGLGGGGGKSMMGGL